MTDAMDNIITKKQHDLISEPDNFGRVKVGTVYETDRGDIMVYRWHEQYTYNYVHDPVLDLDQGFCREARALIEEYKLSPPDYTPKRNTVTVWFSHRYDEQGRFTIIHAEGVKDTVPLRLNGYWPTPPTGYKCCVFGNRVLLKQFLILGKGDPITRYFTAPDKPVNCLKLQLFDGFEQRILVSGLPQNLNSQSDFAPIWVDGSSVINKDAIGKIKGELERINMSKEWNLGSKKSSLFEQFVSDNSRIPPAKHKYHKLNIVKGKTGFFSKIEEEFMEAKDAFLQQNPVMLFVELADMLGAIEKFLEKNYPGVTLDGLVKHAKETNEVFRQGGRPDNDPLTDPGTR